MESIEKKELRHHILAVEDYLKSEGLSVIFSRSRENEYIPEENLSSSI